MYLAAASLPFSPFLPERYIAYPQCGTVDKPCAFSLRLPSLVFSYSRTLVPRTLYLQMHTSERLWRSVLHKLLRFSRYVTSSVRRSEKVSLTMLPGFVGPTVSTTERH